MEYHHKSGAQKRKDKSAREVQSTRGQTSLSRWGFHSKSEAQETENPSSADRSRSTAETDAEANTATLNQSEDVPVLEFDGSNLPNEEGQPGSKTAEDSAPVQSAKIELLKVDIGNYEEQNITAGQVEDIIRRGHEPTPQDLPRDSNGHEFIHSLLKMKMQNGQHIDRDWMVWSQSRRALYCLPCRLFSDLPKSSRSSLTLPCGYSNDLSWRKLYDKVPEHESSANHKKCYIKWREDQRRIEKGETVKELLCESIRSEAATWRTILRRLLDVTLFLAERGLAFRGGSSLIGDISNGNFLGTLELIAHYDPVLAVHLEKVKESQKTGTRMQAHYLSSDTQNEFISCCATEVLRFILEEREASKYFSIMVDATPDSAHIEQTVFVLRYLICRTEEEEEKYMPVERFLAFVDCNQKTGEAIAQLILDTLEKHNISLKDCRGQGYDNGSNMAGPYKGAQARILGENPLALFCPCGCHSLNLCGEKAVESCKRAVTFFGVVQNLYNVCSGSPQRWDILLNVIKASLHSLSETRWSQRADAVKPFSTNLPGLITVVEEIKLLNLTPETKATLNGISNYLRSFECVLMSSIWYKVLLAIDQRNTILQARSATLDVEVANIKSLLQELKTLRNDGWPRILNECKLVYQSINPSPPSSDAAASVADSAIPKKRRRKAKTFSDESPSTDPMASKSFEETFKVDTFYVLLDSVILNLSTRYDNVNAIFKIFQFIWKYLDIDEEQLRQCSETFQEMYRDDVGPALFDEIIHLKAIHTANFGPKPLAPLNLLNKIKTLNLEILFPNVSVALRIFCTLPVTVAQAERSFSTLARVKNVLRSTTCQGRLSNLGLLCVEARLAKQVDLERVIDEFALRKARRKNF